MLRRACYPIELDAHVHDSTVARELAGGDRKIPLESMALDVQPDHVAGGDIDHRTSQAPGQRGAVVRQRQHLLIAARKDLRLADGSRRDMLASERLTEELREQRQIAIRVVGDVPHDDGGSLDLAVDALERDRERLRVGSRHPQERHVQERMHQCDVDDGNARGLAATLAAKVDRGRTVLPYCKPAGADAGHERFRHVARGHHELVGDEESGTREEKAAKPGDVDAAHRDGHALDHGYRRHQALPRLGRRLESSVLHEQGRSRRFQNEALQAVRLGIVEQLPCGQLVQRNRGEPRCRDAFLALDLLDPGAKLKLLLAFHGRCGSLNRARGACEASSRCAPRTCEPGRRPTPIPRALPQDSTRRHRAPHACAR